MIAKNDLPPNEAPRAAALSALATLPPAEPLPSVGFSTAGRLAIVGELEVACGWAERLAGQREVVVLATAGQPEPDPERTFSILPCPAPTLNGHLGAFVLSGNTESQAAQIEVDVVLDLSQPPLLKRVALPDGYAAPGRDPLDQALAVIELLGFDGEFEKPRYVAFDPKRCAHRRSQKTGCNNCLDACATEAIRSAGEQIEVDPYLCQGCGTCATVCPSGALSYQYPRVPELGLAIQTALQAFRAAGGAHPALLFQPPAGRKRLQAELRAGQRLPSDFIPLDTWSADAVGLDLLLGAIALGASRIAVLGTGSHDLSPLRRQAALAETLLAGLGHAGEHVRIIDTETPGWLAALADWPAPAALPAADFRLQADKRSTLELALAHLAEHGNAPAEPIALPAGAPFGAVDVSAACTLCMACASACPASALEAGVDAPRLSFLEKACVQCGLCVATCPESAVTLTPRWLAHERTRKRVLREAEVFHCSVCGKPMGAAPTIHKMIASLSQHSMFATPAAQARLSMCADCRVIDLIQHEGSLKAWELSE